MIMNFEDIPPHHYRQVRFHEKKFWKSKAIKHYEKILDLWKEADPGIPEVEDAGKRVAGLKN